MFFFKSKKKNMVYAPVNGTVFPLQDLNDGVFSSMMLGDGIGFRFDGALVVSPCYGEVIMVAKTKHAVGIRLKNDAELLVHVGLDTVELNGEGLQTMVKKGDLVRPGEAIIRVDRKFMEDRHVDLSSALIVTNGAGYAFDPTVSRSVQMKDELFDIDRR